MKDEQGCDRRGVRIMRRWADLLALCAAAWLLLGGPGGCDVPEGGPPAGKAGSEVRPPAPPPLPKVAGDPAPSAVEANQPPPKPTPSTASGVPAIRLSAGVALPQTGPTGRLMSFSVDYRFTSAEPNPTSPYVWVIERKQGAPARQPVRLRGQGTLPILIPGWRPEQGPFQAHIEDTAGNRLSRSISLRPL